MVVGPPPSLGRLAPLLLALLLCACAGRIEGLYPPAGAEDCRTVRLVRHSWHLGLLLAAEDVPAPLAAHFPGARYLEFGWGDRAYYMSQDDTAGLALRAALVPTDSVMHVAGFAAPLRPGTQLAEEVIEIGVSRAGVARMAASIWQDFELDPRGQPVVLSPGLYGDSRFFASGRTYHLFRTSNSWSASKLHQAGFPIAPPFPLTAGDVAAAVQAQGPTACNSGG